MVMRIEDEAIIRQSRMYARSLFLLWLLACGRAVAEGDRIYENLLSASSGAWGQPPLEEGAERRGATTGPLASVRESVALEEEGERDFRPENASHQRIQKKMAKRRLPVHDVDNSSSEDSHDDKDEDDDCDKKAPQPAPVYVWPPSDPHHGGVRPFPTYPPTRKPVPTPRPTDAPAQTPPPSLRPIATSLPTQSPTPRPSVMPIRTPAPTPLRTMQPTARPTPQPVRTPAPASIPTIQPSRRPVPTNTPTLRPSSLPSASPSVVLMPIMTVEPTTLAPTRPPGTVPPTPALVCSPPITQAEREDQLFDIVSTVSSPLALLNPETSQFDAFFWLVNIDPVQVCPESELDVVQRYVAALLYDITLGSQWSECNAEGSPIPAPCDSVRWLSGGSVCTWFGVSCDEGSNEIQSIILPENNLRGRLPRELSSLPQLARLDFRGNINLSGSIPTAFGTLNLLLELFLQENTFQESIPEQLFDADLLEVIDLSQNNLMGTIPTSIVNAVNLEVFDVEENSIGGSLPPDLPASLRFFLASTNALVGPLPPNLADNTNLVAISVGENQISGPLPEFVGSLPNLQTLNFFGNNFTGPIPSSLGRLSNLEDLFLHFNRFTGTMPASVCALNLNQLTADCGPRGTVQCDCCTLCF